MIKRWQVIRKKNEGTEQEKAINNKIYKEKRTNRTRKARKDKTYKRKRMNKAREDHIMTKLAKESERIKREKIKQWQDIQNGQNE